MRISHLLRAGLVAITLPAVFVSPVTAVSQTAEACSRDVSTIIAQLEKDYGETVVAIALNKRGHMVQWLANEDTGSWSMVVSLPNDAGCLTAAGEHFEIMPVQIGERS